MRIKRTSPFPPSQIADLIEVLEVPALGDLWALEPSPGAWRGAKGASVPISALALDLALQKILMEDHKLSAIVESRKAG